MTVTQWKTPDDQITLIYITNNGGSIEDIYAKFKDADPAITRPACCPLLRVVAERGSELDHHTAQAFADLFTLCV